jgi:hypothetical protein
MSLASAVPQEERTMKVKSSEYPEDQQLTTAAILVIVLLPADEASGSRSSDGARYATRSSDERTAY